MITYLEMENQMWYFSAPERDALRDALNAAYRSGSRDILACLERLAAARRRTQLRQDSDRMTDPARRILVGARLPRPLAEQYRACAAGHGLSLYRFVCNALEREYRRLTE